jgi:hypothetical protein
MTILRRPEPPDAIIELDGIMTWLEITDAFFDRAHAISLTSGACSDTKHVHDAPRLAIDPDEQFSNVLLSVIEDKYEKATMQSISKHYGQGILLVGVFSPFTTAREVAETEAAAVRSLISHRQIKVFDKIYAYDGTGHREFHVLHSEA